ncbi:type 1 glutamine amidotransferase [Thalassovita gelatinovora]|nr:type 1 glutamine amidotransferase [Thalassovita gelatinovora]QIZ81322.1 type 1 glutamine amidotransferase [Thalassovita gelatinovora]
MRIATLITNTDDSAFARAHPDDGEKFAALIAEARPDWITVPYWVCRDEFPSDIASFDGVMITGSPASVLAGLPWMLQLEDLIREMIAARQPLFGACFGHQMIAKALGASIIPNPLGWAHGRLDLRRVAQAPWSGPEPWFSLYGSHSEQVGDVPQGARVLFEGQGCLVAGFELNGTVFTVQHHPEMTHGFITDLVEEYADEVGQAVTISARASLAQPADRGLFADELARFFDYASAHRAE